MDFSTTVRPATVSIMGPTEAKAEEKVTLSCTTDNSNPASDIKWIVNGMEFNHSNSRTYLASQGGSITTSNITFSINRDARSVVVICQAKNMKLAEYTTKTHTIDIICKFIFLLILFTIYFHLLRLS